MQPCASHKIKTLIPCALLLLVILTSLDCGPVRVSRLFDLIPLIVAQDQNHVSLCAGCY